MTSISDNASIKQFPVGDVIIPTDRQRNAAEADAALISSIDNDGLINPILIHADGTLVAGERRLDAHKKLKRPFIKAIVLENLPPLTAFRLELMENLARKQLSWQEETAAIARYHQMRLDGFAGWTQMGTATDLGISQGQVSKCLVIDAELADPDVAACPTFQGAFNLISGRAERARIAAQSRGLDIAGVAALALPPSLPINATKAERTAALLESASLVNAAAETVSDIDRSIANIEAGRKAAAALQVAKQTEAVSDLIITADCLEWAADYSGPKFDLLHIDFPYGKGFKGSNTRRTGKAHINPTYLDDPDIYFELVDGLLNLQDNFTFPAAHCIFWFDMMYYGWTIERFEAAGWKLVQPYPLIWTKGFTGVASDPKRRPRHCYETALLFSRGDRKISKLTNDHIECALDEKLHMSQKPLPMLRHFLSLVCDEHTAVLDPTCGSGSALAAALQLKAARVLGIEKDASNAEVARFLLQRKAPLESADANS